MCSVIFLAWSFLSFQVQPFKAVFSSNFFGPRSFSIMLTSNCTSKSIYNNYSTFRCNFFNVCVFYVFDPFYGIGLVFLIDYFKLTSSLIFFLILKFAANFLCSFWGISFLVQIFVKNCPMGFFRVFSKINKTSLFVFLP